MPSPRIVSIAPATKASVAVACGTISSTGSRYTGLKGCTTMTCSGLGMPVPSSEGLKPEVDEPMTTSAGMTCWIWVSTRCLMSSRSGTDSWTQRAPATASSTVAQSRQVPSGGSATS